MIEATLLGEAEVKKEEREEVVVSLEEVMASVATSALMAASNATGKLKRQKGIRCKNTFCKKTCRIGLMP